MQQKIIIGLALTLIIAIFVPVYWAMEPGRQEAARERQEAETVERGAELYTSSCAICHGSRGEGNVGPALKGIQLDDEVLERIIARGIPGTAMSAWGEEEGGALKKHPIKDLVTFIKNWDQSLIEPPPVKTPPPTPEPVPKPKPTPAPPPPPTAPTVNADELYAGKCAGCHGVKRQGISGLGLPLTPASLAALSDTEIKDAILNGRSDTAMLAFKGALSPEEIDALLQLIKYTSP